MLDEERESLRSRVFHLEEENDLLATSLTTLQQREAPLLAELERLKDCVSNLERENLELVNANRRPLEDGCNPDQDKSTAAGTVGAGAAGGDVSDPFVVPGDRRDACSRKPADVLKGCHNHMNVLCARVHPILPNIFASGGADKTLLVSHWGASEFANNRSSSSVAVSNIARQELGRLRLEAPVLSLDFCPVQTHGRDLLLVGGMDGASHLVSLGKRSGTRSDKERREEEVESLNSGKFDFQEEGNSALPTSSLSGCEEGKDHPGVSLLSSLKDHSKYVVGCRFSPDGHTFATASHDKVVALYTRNGGTEGIGGTGFTQIRKLYFSEAIECLEFVRGSGGALDLVVAARNQPHLMYVNIDTLQQRKVSLNERDWDAHVSFNIMGLSVSPDGKYLLAATDKNRNILYPVGKNHHVRTLVGHSTDAYFQPRVAWDPSGAFSYCNSSADHDIHLHCLASGRIIDHLKCHTSVVRDIYHHPSAPVLITASYDKSVCLWKGGNDSSREV
ncbi:unnamed protein product [Choristocarpus tenellus]